MDIQTVNNIFKDITESLPDFKGYGFGWPSDRQRGRDPESDIETEYPRVFFAVPTVTQDTVRMQDTYRVVLYFDDLQGYDNDGNLVDVTQLGQWSNLQSLAQKWVQEFKSRQLEREVDYLGLVSQVNVTLDSFASSQRLVSLQMSFNIVAPSSCGISTALKLARALLSSGGNLTANLTVVKQPTANLVASGTVSANLEGGKVVLYAEANLTANLSLTAIGKMARNIVANISAGGTVDSASQLSLPALAELAAMSSVESAGQIAKVSEAILSATATISAMAESQAQGVAYATALLTAQGNISAALSISKQLIASLNAGGNIQAAGLVARMASAALEANAQLLAVAQSVKVAEADLTAVAETQLDAVVSRAVTAQLNAIAQTDLNAIISRSLSASMSATANTSVTAVLANQCVALLSASATLSATIKRAKLPSFDGNAAATISATGTVVSSVDPDAQAFFTATGITDATQRNAINTLVTSLKSAGIWTKMTAVYPFVGGTAARHAVNLKTPGTFNITWSGTVTHNANGVTGNGTNGYGNTGVIPASHLSENSAHMSLYNRNITARNQQEMGVLDVNTPPQAAYILCVSNYSSSSYYTFTDCWAWNATPQQRVLVNNAAAGFTISTRTSTSSLKLFRNGTSLGSFTGTTSGYFSKLTKAITILARNDNGTINGFSTANIAFASIGQGLSDTEASDFRNAVQAYQTALSRNV